MNNNYYNGNKISILKTKCIILTINIFFCFYFNYLPTEHNFNSKFIFTFWEPRNKIPGYLLLCLKTWKIFLPEYKIILLDYSNLPNYLSKNFISKILCKRMTLPIQVDAIRVALLQKFGGIWMDIDTVITNGKILEIFNGSKLSMLGNPKESNQNIGFIYAMKNSEILKKWLKYIIKNICYYRFIRIFKKVIKFEYLKKEWNKVQEWNYLGNGIVDKLLMNTSKYEFLRIDRLKIGAFPELNYLNNISSSKYKYQLFYFSKGDANKILNITKGIICLHNSWTPEKYKNISKEEFIHLDIVLSKLISLFDS